MGQRLFFLYSNPRWFCIFRKISNSTDSSRHANSKGIFFKSAKAMHTDGEGRISLISARGWMIDESNVRFSGGREGGNIKRMLYWMKHALYMKRVFLNIFCILTLVSWVLWMYTLQTFCSQQFEHLKLIPIQILYAKHTYFPCGSWFGRSPCWDETGLSCFLLLPCMHKKWYQ